MAGDLNTRNFSIIAHIDHGKSTLADRLLEYTGAITKREAKDQILDDMDLERERGITIKAHAVRLNYRANDGNDYILNLIDTPGHVDFAYEVSRSLAACEGALLLIDASQGIEAQTIANVNLAIENQLIIIPVINKIDLPTADSDRIKREIEDVLCLDASDTILASAKQGIGTKEILEAIVSRIPPPSGDINMPLKGLIFDSWFDNYQGIIILTRIVDGRVKEGNKIRLISTNKSFEVNEVGVFTPKREATKELSSGEVGYIIAGIKSVNDTKIGDTITDKDSPCASPLPGYKEVKPMVFCGLYSVDNNQYGYLKGALAKLRLNDSSFIYEPETSLALGFGFRCGFLGLLHMDIIRERLEREYNLSLISTSPTTLYKITSEKGDVITIQNPSKLSSIKKIKLFEEPYILTTIILPQDYLGQILKLCQDRRGIQREISYLERERVMIKYELPLNEVILDFYDRLKSFSKGYASLDYELLGYRESDLVKVDILLNGEIVDALSFITHRDKAYIRGRAIAKKMKEAIPRQLFEVAIQAAIGNKIVARETISALRKNVIAKCYGGDITRKKKLLKKQKEGKKKMKHIGTVEVPQEAFLALLKSGE
ncbi:MAG: translation elongation factor 4 [Nitrospirota bacterium]